MLYTQTTTVTGVVTDANNVPMPGVNIQVKGTSRGATTNFDGDYTINASSGDVLIFSYVGFKKTERTVSEAVINVKLEEDASSLDEVVVTAFGIKRETRELGYSVTQVKTEDLNLTGQTDALSALQGQVAGLQITKTSGSSGGGIDILIRGITSVNPNRSNQPLIIIDGLALDNETFSGNVKTPVTPVWRDAKN